MMFIVILALSCNAAFGWDQSNRDTIIKMHNDYRKGTQGACHMNKVEYDMDMEKAAEAYAKQCVYKHKFDKFGENFAYFSKDKSVEHVVKTGIDLWYGEIKDYTYGQNACGDSNTCHYTQIVAAGTKKIGCYVNLCSNLQGAAPNVYFYVCYYTPKGNWKGEDAYPKKCDSPCKKGQTEEDGLCVGEGEDETEKFECKDTTHYCKVWKETDNCKLNPKYMNKKCPVACGVCTPEGGAGGAEDSCLDNDPRCPSFAERGECQKRVKDMKARCPKSCKLC